ncbi:hypothetical protein MYA_4917 [Burkholderia sp. KJ006]|nr:hypothetical protein MYA_4917 [Burkholderia sp. KJ006]
MSNAEYKAMAGCTQAHACTQRLAGTSAGRRRARWRVRLRLP